MRVYQATMRRGALKLSIKVSSNWQKVRPPKEEVAGYLVENKKGRWVACRVECPISGIKIRNLVAMIDFATEQEAEQYIRTLLDGPPEEESLAAVDGE